MIINLKVYSLSNLFQKYNFRKEFQYGNSETIVFSSSNKQSWYYLKSEENKYLLNIQSMTAVWKEKCDEKLTGDDALS
jgi:hypothetical protein